MKLSSTEVICSRDTSLSSAMATPSLCTSRASSCFSRLAASCSPKLMSKIAARSVPARSLGLLAIGGNPILDYLCGPLGILPDQGSSSRDLLLKTRRQLDRIGGALSRQAQAVSAHIVSSRARPGRLGAPGEGFHQRPQDQKRHQEHEARA